MEKKLTRREARENAFLVAFSATFQPDDLEAALQAPAAVDVVALDGFSVQLLRCVMEHNEQIDAVIESHLKDWAIARLPRVSLVAMRIALAEMLYGEDKRPGVAINEAVELVKKYGADNDYQFVNGLLGVVAREQAPEAAPGEPC